MKEKELSPIHKTIAGVQFLFVAFGSTYLSRFSLELTLL